MANDQTIQALQGLTFGGSNDGIGIGLALLQARSQAANQSQVASTQLTSARQQPSGAAPRFPGRLMNSTHSYPSGLNPYAAQPPPSLYSLNPSSAQFVPRGPAYGGAKPGPGDANAGPRMFVGKLNKETSEQDIKVSLQFGYRNSLCQSM